MKKLLLIAAMAALAFGANADGYKLEKVWELSTSSVYNSTGVNIANVRQGFGMNGKFYFNDKNTADGAIPTIYEVDENGFTGVTFEGGRNCGITHDEAGNIIVSDATFPGGWVQATIKVINPETGEVKVYEIPEECGMAGRCDFLGFPKGNLMEDGVLYLTGKTSADVFTPGMAVFTVTDGEVNFDECYLAVNDDITAATARDNMTVINYYEDLNGDPAMLFVYRSVGIYVKKLTFDGEVLNCESIGLPDKGACSGTFPLVWDGKELFIYPQTPNYLDGFAISEGNATEPLFVVAPTVSANQNGYQANWLNAEVDEDGVTIYQYAPGANFVVYRLTKEAEEMVYTVVGPEEIFGTNWNPNDENNNLELGENGYTWHKEGVTLYNGFEFKVVGNHDYAIYEWPMGPNNWVANLPDGEGIYDIDIIFNPDAEDEFKISCILTKTGDVTPIDHVYTVCGPSAIFGSEWDATDANNDMVLDPETGLYTWTKENVELNDNFGFKVVGDHSWANEWPQGYDNNWVAYLPDGAGIYNIVITYDPAEPVERITCTLTRVDAPTYLRGDVDDNQSVNISDVTALINYLLSKNAEGVNLAAADCDESGTINISDVTTLINYLLSKQWPAE